MAGTVVSAPAARSHDAHHFTHSVLAKVLSPLAVLLLLATRRVDWYALSQNAPLPRQRPARADAVQS